MIVFCVGILIHSRIARFYQMSWIALHNVRLAGKWNLTLPNAIQGEEKTASIFIESG